MANFAIGRAILMGSSPRPKPERLPEKLLQIRLSLELSQDGMLKHLGLDESHFRSAISGYELGTREPPLPVLLNYARLAGVWVDVLIDDELDLPARLPSVSKSEGIRRASKAKANRGSKVSKKDSQK
jgi:transcriptional regulator with XRE-family HTH domain